MASKIQEAEEHVKAAQKCLKTGLLKWKPDYDSAADELTKAATCYKNARSFQKAIDTSIEAADILEKHLNNLFHSAKQLEQAGLLCKETKDWTKAEQCFGRAGLLLRQNGTTDSAAVVLQRAAKTLEEANPKSAAKFYTQAADALEIDDKYYEAAESIMHACRMYVRLEDLDSARNASAARVDLCRQGDNTSAMSKAVLLLVLLELARDDEVAAVKGFTSALSYPHFSSTDDHGALALLLQAFQEKDAAAGRQALQCPVFRNMDNEFARLARDLKLPDSGGSGSKNPEDGDDLEAGALC